MIDHVSIPVTDLALSKSIYLRMLETLGYRSLMEDAQTVGFGKDYPDFWLNQRSDLDAKGPSDGFHVCLRARSVDIVDAFYQAALDMQCSCDGKPGLRPQYHEKYYAAFVRDPDGNRIEVVTFVE